MNFWLRNCNNCFLCKMLIQISKKKQLYGLKSYLKQQMTFILSPMSLLCNSISIYEVTQKTVKSIFQPHKWLQVSQRYLKLEFVQKSSLCECYLIINQHLSVPSFELYNYLNVVLLIITQHQMKCQSLINGPYSLKSLR